MFVLICLRLFVGSCFCFIWRRDPHIRVAHSVLFAVIACVATCGRLFSGSVCVCFFVFVACDRSTSPPGGNQVDGLPPALGL